MTSRAEVFVYLAFGIGWLLVAGWVLRIGAKVNRIHAQLADGDDENRRAG